MISQVDSRTARIPEWDGIRGLAILLVVFFHFFTVSSDTGGLPTRVISAVLSFGWSGVDLFFVLSGFLIGGILMDNRSSANYFKTFYIRRVCRIFPLYFLWLALFFVLPWLLPSNFPGYRAVFAGGIAHLPQWGYALFLQNFYIAKVGDFGSFWMAATWSLCVEEQFYLLLPLMIRFVFPRKPLWMFIILVALVPLLRVFLFLFHPSIFTFVLLPCRADALLLGVLGAYMIRQ
jgi:peptidoglycan/LPS O-acetylase OafA/YrhL